MPLASDGSHARNLHEEARLSSDRGPDSATEPQAERGHEEHDQSITGQSTLAEAARMAGVPVERLTAELKLRAATPPDQRLGHLRRQYDFTMSDVRAIVARLKRNAEPE